MPYLVGVDTGGTFTDFALYDGQTHSITLHKYPSTPDDPSAGVINGLIEILQREDIQPSDVSALTHGTTVATNAVLEDRIEDIGMITTAGFRDILELGRQRRPHLYNLDVEKPRPLAPRRLRLEVTERLNAQGLVQAPLNEAELEVAVNALRGAGVSAVAICFLHAYQNAAHERRARAVLRRLFPEALVTISSDVLRESREYERFATTAVNAALLPVMSRYLDHLGRRVRRLGIPTAPRISASFGTTVSLRTAKTMPVATLYSGPSAGVIGATAVASASGFKDIITLDMGGTSTDVCLVHEGTPLVARERVVAGWPVVAASVDVHSVGTGGGSLLWTDEGGYLQVGPQSAGADPGPACYNLGSTSPTVTDANVVAGRLSPTRPLGGSLKVWPDLAAHAIQQGVADPLGLSEERAVAGVFMVLTSNLVRAVRVVSVERGFDPRSFALVAFGGAGPMHASQLARDMGISTLIVPEAPGVLCALGLLMADMTVEFSQSRLITVTPGESSTGQSTHRDVERVFADLERRASRWIRTDGIDRASVTTSRTIEARYLGQGHEIPVSVDGGIFEAADIRRLTERFHRLYEERYGYARLDSPVTFVHFRLRAGAPGPRPRLYASRSGDRNHARALVGSRNVYIEGASQDGAGGFCTSPIYWRPKLMPDDRLDGPAIIEQMDSTTVLLPGQEAFMDQYRNLIISVRPAVLDARQTPVSESNQK